MMGLFFPIFIVGLASWVNAGYNVGVGRADITGPAAEVFAIILPGLVIANFTNILSPLDRDDGICQAGSKHQG